jgi:hypothetical protein
VIEQVAPPVVAFGAGATLAVMGRSSAMARSCASVRMSRRP